jgi:hypothetical protein
VQELLEGEADPALALLHKLTRLDAGSIRLNVLRDKLVPKTTVPMPDGGELELKTPAPPTVAPLDFASAVEGAVDKVLALNVDPAAKFATIEDLKMVAKEAREVIEEAPTYDEAILGEFSDALTPPFERYFRAKQAASGPTSEPN